MTGKTHQIIGLTTGVATLLSTTSPTYQAATVGWVVAASVIGSLLPDIDQPSSRLWRALPFGGFAGELVNPFLEHRNLTHSLLGVGIVSWGVYIVLSHVPTYWDLNTHAIFISFLAAYLSHLVADMVTVEGVPLLFPIPRMFGIPPHPFAGIRIITGKWFENLIVFPVANAALLSIVITHSATLKTMLFK
jgi:inner membrane protein